MPKKIRVEWHPKTRQICQIPKDGLEYALVSEDYRQIHQLVWCKDFLQDAIYGAVNRTRVCIYGFEYDPFTYPPVSLDRTRLIVTNWKDADFEHKLTENCQDFLHQVETILKLRQTSIFPCSNPPPRYRKAGIFLLEGSKRWMKAPPMISLYTLLIRIGMVHPVGKPAWDTIEAIRNGSLLPYNHHPNKDTDRDLVRQTLDGIKRIWKYGDRRLFHRTMKDNYPLKNHSGGTFSVHQMHEYCGMVGFTSCYNKQDVPYWYRLQ